MIRKLVIMLLTLAAVVVAASWVGSHFRKIAVYREFGENWVFTLNVENGNAHGFVSHFRPHATEEGPFFHIGVWPSSDWSDCLAFGVYTFDKRGFQHSGALFPMWSLLLFVSLYPAVALRRMRRRRHRQASGLCLICGYDLRGTESGVCPECGREVRQA